MKLDRLLPTRRRVLVGVHEPVLGTVLQTRIEAPHRIARAAEAALVDEIERLENDCSIYRENSRYRRWRVDDTTPLTPELADLLRASLRWQSDTNGIYNPAVGVLTDRWTRAEVDGRTPTDEELRALAESIRTPRYVERSPGVFSHVGDCASLRVHAFAKGFIVDRATTAVANRFGVHSIVVNAGGDLVHRGRGFVDVGIENPHRPYDNEPPLATVRIANAGLATSGASRRGFSVGGRWFSHVIDPRTGMPVDAVVSASVVAQDAATADAVATVLSVLPPSEGLAQAERFGAAAMVVAKDGTTAQNQRWTALLRV